MLDIYFFNVGHGDSIAINFPNGEWGIIDCNRALKTEEPPVLRFLKNNNIKKINFLCITHPHSDHYNGCEKIIEYCSNNIKNLILYDVSSMNNIDKDTSLGKALIEYKKINRTVDNALDKIICARRGESINIGDVVINFLNPTDRILKKLNYDEISLEKVEFNAASVIFYMLYENIKILLTADSTTSNWMEILKNNDEYVSDVIKISHHGSIENNPFNLLEKLVTKGTYSIISTDGGIRYSSLPSAEVIKSLNKLETKLTLTSDIDITEETEETEENNIYANSREKYVIKKLGKDINIPRKDGYIKISILEDRKIIQNNVLHF